MKPMKCSEVREMVQEYLEDSLKGEDLRAFEAHLEQCRECRLELESVQALDARLKQEAPALWESIEPSPAFLNRLKHMELEPEKASIWSFFDPLMALFQDHRPAMAAGLTVLIAVVLGITIIPGIISEEGDKHDMIAEAPSEAVMENLTLDEDGAMNKGVADRSTGSGGFSGEGMQEALEPDDTLAGSSWEAEEEELPAPGTVPESAPPPLTETSEEMFSVTICADSASHDEAVQGEAYDQEYPAIRIALDDTNVKEALLGETIWCVQALSEVDLEDYVCSGSTVAIALSEAGFLSHALYVCVDSGSETVTHMMFLP
jgi:hypothetical protein